MTGGMPTTLAEVELLVGGITSFDGEGAASIEGPASTLASPTTASTEPAAGSAGAGGGQPTASVTGWIPWLSRGALRASRATLSCVRLRRSRASRYAPCAGA